MQRTDWAEQFAEDFYSRPLVRECVLRSAKHLDGGLEKEVCDFVSVLRGDAILIQMKCQEDPTLRYGEKLERWVIKQANAALTQLRGSLRTISEHNFWCDHPRRGRVDFAKGQLSPIHGIALVEQFEGRIVLPTEFPMECSSVPISYFTTNDFLNIVDQLRTFPEIVQYLKARHSLSIASIRAIGGEGVFYRKYILDDGNFRRWTTYEDATAEIERCHNEVNEKLAAKQAADRDANFLEYVADQLSDRSNDPIEGLPAHLAAGFEPRERRIAYLRMQEEICDLPLSERRALGKQFLSVVERAKQSGAAEEFSYAVAYPDSKPHFLYAFASSRGFPRPTVLQRADFMLRAALTHYEKSDGMAIVDRDGQSFEVVLRGGFVPCEADQTLAREIFGRLRVFDIPMGLVPRTS